eukprot:gene9838-25142_t
MKLFSSLVVLTMITGSTSSQSRTAFSVTGKLRCRGFDDRFPEGKAKRAHQCVHDCFIVNDDTVIAIRASDDVLDIAGQLKTKETLFTVKEVPAKDHQAAKMAAT